MTVVVSDAHPFRLTDWPVTHLCCVQPFAYRVMATSAWGDRWLHPKLLPWGEADDLAKKVMAKREIAVACWEPWPFPKFDSFTDRRRVGAEPSRPWVFIKGD